MKRHPQWEQRLNETVARYRSKPYDPSHHDCLLWPANVAKAVTGKDPGSGHLGKYKSHAGGYAYLRKTFGVDSPAALLDTLFPEKPVGFAGRGDIVLCRVDQLAGSSDEAPIPGEVPGLCLGAFALVAAADGLQRVPRGDRWLKAWAVGDYHSGEAP
jgi:hypothetical protein